MIFKDMVKIRKSKRGDKYIIPETKGGLHISIHRSGHAHVKNGGDVHADIEGISKKYLTLPGIDESMKKGNFIVRPCEKYPECACVDLTINPKLIEDKNYQKLCYTLRKSVRGGPCPSYHQIICMWSGFCRRKIDPTRYALWWEGKVDHFPKEDGLSIE